MKTFWIVLITVIITGGIVGGSMYYYLNSKSNKQKTDLQAQIDNLNKITNSSHTYQNDTCGYSFVYSSGWSAGGDDAKAVYVNKDGGSRLGINCGAFDSKLFTASGGKVVSSENTKINGYTAVKRTLNDGSSTYFNIEISSGNKVVFIDLLDSGYQETNPGVQQIINSFKFL
ncbi:MAG: hypothetical protein NTW79_04290 [Candidatus Berkelbacteria bacterium]|nr:hypothetical protein [Candidatus Berkelbacteria bacterium]